MKAANDTRAPLGDAAKWIRDIAAESGAVSITWYVGETRVAVASYPRNFALDDEFHAEIARLNPGTTRIEIVDGGITHVFTVHDGEPPEDTETP